MGDCRKLSLDECLKKCDNLKGEAYSICVDQCYERGEYDPLLIKILYYRHLNETTRSIW